MKKLLLIIAISLISSGIAKSALDASFYAKRSVLADGKWVKIGVSETGVYEISYSMLRAMGFQNPEKVALYGRGGRVMPEDFVTASGKPQLQDDLSAVPVLHADGKMYFYGLGPEEINFTANTELPTQGYFTRASNNIYSYRGYYFLTDSSEPLKMDLIKNGNSSAVKQDKFASYLYHELDSLHNNTVSGQLFWGEYLGKPYSPERSWKVEMPDAIAGPGYMECILYFSNHDNANATVSYGFKEADSFSTPYHTSGTSYFAYFSPGRAEINVPGNKGTVFARLDYDSMMDQSFLDYWVVTYNRTAPTLKDSDGKPLNQQLIALSSLQRNETGEFELNDCESFVVIDVTTGTSPRQLQINDLGAGKGNVKVTRSSSSVPQLVVFDTQRSQKQISGFESSYSPVANQNLHSYKDAGADFVIITTDEFRSQAEEIAQLHRQYDGIDVIVATADECYNEFSAGVPDPMAYRSFMKMLYMSPKQPKNLLLFGPLYSDVRGLNVERNPKEGLIAYQSPNVSISRGAHNINDFYGCMTDTYRKDYYERNEVNIGVAILPVKFKSEADIMVEKIRNHLTRTDYAYFLNRYTAVSGIGDEHTHDMQVNEVSDYLKKFDGKATIVSPLSIDTYGNQEAHKKFINSLNDGCNMISYFGHGAEMFLGKDRLFFSAGDVNQLRNEIAPFALFAGCHITNTDRGMRGLGETIITTTKYGCIGGLVSARETWSGQNLEFCKLFMAMQYQKDDSGSSERLTERRTIGEIYKYVKHYSTFNNELAYQLMCDPALVIPTMNRSISIDGDVVPQCGETIRIKGHVNNGDGNKDNTFNGEVVVRMMEPTIEVGCGMIESGENPGNLKYQYSDNQVSMGVAEVKNGAFEVDIHVPGSTAVFDGRQANLYFAAYNPKTKNAAGLMQEITYKKPAGISSESGDKIPPVIESLSFDEVGCSVYLAVSDNVALNTSSNPMSKGLFLYIDGKERSEAHFVEPRLESGRAAYTKNVAIEGLDYGDHTLRLRVKDAAGNETDQEMVFTYNPLQPKYVLTLADDAEAGTSRFLTDGNAPGKATLIILNSTGDEIWSGDFSGDVLWNQVDNNGRKVAPGHYKAYIIERGTSQRKGHSATIDVPVI